MSTAELCKLTSNGSRHCQKGEECVTLKRTLSCTWIDSFQLSKYLFVKFYNWNRYKKLKLSNFYLYSTKLNFCWYFMCLKTCFVTWDLILIQSILCFFYLFLPTKNQYSVFICKQTSWRFSTRPKLFFINVYYQRTSSFLQWQPGDLMQDLVIKKNLYFHSSFLKFNYLKRRKFVWSSNQFK